MMASSQENSSLVVSRILGPGLLTTILVLVVLLTLNFLPAESKPGRHVLDVSCYDNDGIPYIESIPHPTDCTKFYKCDRYAPDKPLEPIPYIQECSFPPSPQLYFDLETCDCQFLPDATCFDPSNQTHAENRMKCACPLITDSEELASDRCSGIGERFR